MFINTGNLHRSQLAKYNESFNDSFIFESPIGYESDDA